MKIEIRQPDESYPFAWATTEKLVTTTSDGRFTFSLQEILRDRGYTLLGRWEIEGAVFKVPVLIDSQYTKPRKSRTKK